MFFTKYLDCLLIFEVLMYINLYYYPVFEVSNAAIIFAKYKKIVNSPKIEIDASVQGGLLLSELLKLLLFNKVKEKQKELAISLTVILAIASCAGLYYIFFMQQPILKLEFIVDSIIGVLLIGEVLYGILALMPCCKKEEYS